MLHKVAFGKAVLAGAAGAAAWEIAARLLIVLGVPIFDIVRLLGTMGGDVGWAWWPLGFAMHVLVGAIWAIFYSYFFWATLRARPVVQGLVFSVIPMLLAGLVMVPQLGAMHPAITRGELPQPGIFGWRLGWGGPLGVVLGHVIFGLISGALYTRPVGYSTTRETRPLRFRRSRREEFAAQPAAPVPGRGFMFATGIECSYPTIENGRWRMDELRETGHYRQWRRDLELVRELGVRYLRYGPPLHRMFRGPGQYDWDFMDEVGAAMQQLGITPIVDLCHFGLPRWLGTFQNPEFPAAFAEYAAAFAQRYPWVRLYTPVNEMYVTARLSAVEGLWNEQMRDERAFVTAVKHLASASVLAAEAILRRQPDVIFINSESSEFYQACCPDERVMAIADFENERRFMALDLLYGHEPRRDVRDHLFRHGLSPDEYAWFMNRDVVNRCIVGLDYYDWNEKVINSEGRVESLGELFGWYVITQQYYERYRRPMMHTETNCLDAARGPDWLWRQWHNLQLMRRSGVPVVGFTWYSLVDQVDWNIGLSRPVGHVNPVGLYDFNRDRRPVAEAYAQLLKLFGNEPLLPQRPDADLSAVLDAANQRPLERDCGRTTPQPVPHEA